VLNSTTGGSKGVGTLNADELYRKGARLTGSWYTLCASSNGAASASTTNFTGCGSVNSINASEAGAVQVGAIPFSGTVGAFGCSTPATTTYIPTDPGNTKSYAFTLRDMPAAGSAFADTTSTCTETGNGSTVTSCTDTTHHPSVTQLDQLTVKIVPSGTPTALTVRCWARIDPT